jgi:hypothetical protein
LIKDDDGSIKPLLTWIQFEAHSNQGLYAKGWFFLVHEAFKSALDIFHVERINKEKTPLLRDSISFTLAGIPHQKLKEKLKSENIQLKNSDLHNKIMDHKIKDLVETQGAQMKFSFKKGDSLETRCGNWCVQVDQARDDSEEKMGNVGFSIYEKQVATDFQGVWKKLDWFNTSQAEFVRLLETGSCEKIRL